MRNSGMRWVILGFCLLGMALAVLGWWLPAGWRAPLAVAYLVGGPLALLGLRTADIIIMSRQQGRADVRHEPVRRRAWAGMLGALRVEDVETRIGRDRIL